MTFNTVVKHLEVILKLASLLTVFVVGKKCLGAEEPAWEILMDHNDL
jgi:hypothetical protein